MRNKMEKLINEIENCQEINKTANRLIKENRYEDFSKTQLCMIASLSANRQMKLNYEARQLLEEKEAELNECKKMFDERKQPLHNKEELKSRQETVSFLKLKEINQNTLPKI